jgi:Protein kinase domain
MDDWTADMIIALLAPSSAPAGKNGCVGQAYGGAGGTVSGQLPGNADRMVFGFYVGSRVAGYRLEDQVGAGGMAVVFRAVDERLGRQVALKVLSPELAADEEFRERFIRESRAAAAVDDPHLIPVYEAGEAEGVLFIAMRYVAGGDARSLVRRGGPLSPARMAAIVSPVALALDAAHAVGLVHRDVKPANMLLDVRQGRPDHVYLADFGISRHVQSTSGLTGTGQFLGTADYCAPEQIQGAAVDGRADQYALACTVFELLSGRPPFRRDEAAAVIWAQMTQSPPLMTSRRPGLPPAVDGVMEKALAKRPEVRYATCRAFADALRAALGLGPYDSGAPVAAQAERLQAEAGRRAGHADPGRFAAGRNEQFGPTKDASVPRVRISPDDRGQHRGHRSRHRGPRHRSVPLIWMAGIAGLAVAGLVAWLTLANPATRPGPSESPQAGAYPERTGGVGRAGPLPGSANVMITVDTTLTSDIFCSDLTIESGVILTTNGYNIYCSGTVNNQGTVVTGASVSQNFPLSYGGSGGGATGQRATAGLSTLSAGGAPCIISGCTAANGSAPARPSITAAVLISWYHAGMNQYLAGAMGGSSPNATGGAGANGLFIEANRIIAGNLDCAGSDGENAAGVSSAGGGGGGVILIAYVSSLTNGHYLCGGGYTIAANESQHEFGGVGAVISQRFSRLPISINPET